MGCDEQAHPPSRPIMPLSDDEPICPKFQPNIFDPSRCHDCLRQRHLHAGAGQSAEVAPQQKSTADTGTVGITGTGKGGLLTPIPSQAEERDTSSIKVRKNRSQKGRGRREMYRAEMGARAECVLSDGISST